MTALAHDQASSLRRLMAAQEARPARRPAHRRARVVAVASGKGGVGKTNIAVNLALCLANEQRQVVLVDADLGTANADVVMNLQPPFDLSHVLRRERSIDEVAISVSSGLRLIAGASGLATAADLQTQDRVDLIDEFARLEAESDLIVLDCGAGISQNVLAFARAADMLLVVTTPEPTAVTDAYALVKVLSRSEPMPAVGLVVNQAASAREGRVVAERIASVAARYLRLPVDSFGQILRDPHVPRAIRERVPVVRRYPRCSASSGLSALAEKVAQPVGNAAGEGGFFRRVLGFFY